MKQLMIFFAFGMAAIFTVHAGDYTTEIDASRATAKEFMQTLKQELQAGMQEGGPVNAISVCNLSAPGIANTYSVRRGWDVGRTSLKVRNPANAPDAWERSVLESFEARKGAGEDPAKLEFYEVVRQHGVKELRYMKAIPTAQLCLACHGENIDSITGTRLNKLYPDDQARGYKAGDIRGAFSISQSLDTASK
ncbi:MAG: DUF3365 domain-containing protein [Gammaproteobacteria bacterium]|nr:DUF3365 domain-containing protein [Gammaproteobacteria bacterium]